LVTLYENLECLSITAFGGKHECRFSALARDVPPFPTLLAQSAPCTEIA